MAKIDGGIADAGSEEPAADEHVILVVCPTHRDHRELKRISPPGINYLCHDYASISLEDLICNVASHAGFAGPLEEMEAISLMLQPRAGSATRAAAVREGIRPPAQDA